MYISLLQPKLKFGEIASNAQEIVSLVRSRKTQKRISLLILYVAGCETTIGGSCAALRHTDTVPVQQLAALKKIQRSLGKDALLIGGVQLNRNVKPLALQHQLFFLTNHSQTPLLPECPLALGTTQDVSVEDERYKLTIRVRNWGDYYHLSLFQYFQLLTLYARENGFYFQS